MTILKRLATTLFEALVRGFATAAPFYGAPALYRAFGMRGPLSYRGRMPR
jgi:hypothetical protein